MIRKPNSSDAVALIGRQRLDWGLATSNYKALSDVKVKEFDFGNARFKVQFNPARIVSSSAKVDPKSIAERKCFLCAQNRPEVQEELPYDSNFTILVNPFPIFPQHLTIPVNAHTDQLIRNYFGDMLDLAKDLDGFTIFYNGPKCGASAPDHMHFQAGNKGFMTIENEWRKTAEVIGVKDSTTAYTYSDGMRTAFILEGRDKKQLVTRFESLYELLETKPGEQEPMMNLLAWYEDGKYIAMIFPRAQHRPGCYTATGDANMLISPASVDMGGVFITPREEDFLKITPDAIRSILQEVCLSEEKMNAVADKLKKSL